MATQAEKTAAVTDAQATLSAAQVALTHAKALAVSDPAPAPAPQPSPTPTPGAYPGWRTGKAAGQWYEIGGTSNMAGAVQSTGSDIIDVSYSNATPGASPKTLGVWNGLAALPDGFCSILGGGDGGWLNGAHRLRLNLDQPQWQTLDVGSQPAAVTISSPYYTDGRPASRHTYLQMLYLPGQFTRDGKDRVMAIGAASMVGVNHGGIAAAGTVDGFRLLDKAYDPAGTFSSIPNSDAYPSACVDPRNGNVYIGNHQAILRYRALDEGGTPWRQMVRWDSAIPGASMLEWSWGMQFCPVLVDTVRNRLVCLHSGIGADLNSGGTSKPRLLSSQLDANGAVTAVTNVYVTGLPPYSIVACFTGFTHDTDADRFYVLVMSGSPVTVRLFQLHPTTGVATELAAPTVAVPTESLENRFAYFPSYKCLVYQARYSTNATFFPTA